MLSCCFGPLLHRPFTVRKTYHFHVRCRGAREGKKKNQYSVSLSTPEGLHINSRVSIVCLFISFTSFIVVSRTKLPRQSIPRVNSSNRSATTAGRLYSVTFAASVSFDIPAPLSAKRKKTQHAAIVSGAFQGKGSRCLPDRNAPDPSSCNTRHPLSVKKDLFVEAVNFLVSVPRFLFQSS